MSTHYVAQYGQELHFFYPSDNQSTLLHRIWSKGKLSPEATLHTGIKLPFSVFHQEGNLHAFCQDTQNNILLYTYRDRKWGSRTVLQGSGSEKILLTPMMSEGNLCILYNGVGEENAPCLFKRSMSSAEWQQAETIDYHKPFAYTPYVAQSTGPSHLILFYQSGVEDCQVGYREITPNRTGPFHRFLNIRGSLADASYLTTHDDLHILMVVKTALSCQLLYRKKTDEDFTPEILLWEAPKIEQCLLSIVGSELHATCTIGGRPHHAISADYGDSFGKMSLYKRKFCAEPVKAGYIPQSYGKAFLARQVYVDRVAPWDVQMLPDLYSGFYPAKPEESSQMQELKDNLVLARMELDAKDMQIMELLRHQSNISENLVPQPPSKGGD